jgi:hypothetical protein
LFVRIAIQQTKNTKTVRTSDNISKENISTTRLQCIVMNSRNKKAAYG